jgi:hypothetical protein
LRFQFQLSWPWRLSRVRSKHEDDLEVDWAQGRKASLWLKFCAEDCGFIQYYPPDESSTCRKPTLSHASAYCKPGVPPIRSMAGVKPIFDVAVHHHAASRPLQPPSPQRSISRKSGVRASIYLENGRLVSNVSAMFPVLFTCAIRAVDRCTSGQNKSPVNRFT